MDEAYISTTASVAIAFNFSTASNAMVKVYASQEAMDRLGAVCVDPFSAFTGEKEVLFNDHAHYRVLDLGQMSMDFTMSDGSESNQKRTCIVLELL